MILLALLSWTIFSLEGSVPRTPSLVVEREGLSLVIHPQDDPLAQLTNDLWREFDLQSSPTPPITEGLFTLYGYSETAWRVAQIRADEYERLLALGSGVRNKRGEMFVLLRDCGVARFRDCLAGLGYSGVLALKADDVGREALVSFWDPRREIWTPKIRMLVLDSLGDGWSRLRDTSHPLGDGVWMRWVGDVSKDALEQVGLGYLVQNNWSGFARIQLDDAMDRHIVWPNY